MEKRTKKRRAAALPFFLALFSVLLLNTSDPMAKEEIKLIGTIYGDESIGSFNQPNGLFFDEKIKRLYLVDTRNDRLLSFDSGFAFLSEFSAEGKLELPISVVKDKRGRLIITESKKNQVTIVDIKGKKLFPLDFSNIPDYKEGSIVPGNLALDSEGRIYVIDRANRRILIFDQQEKYLGEISPEKGLTGFNDIKVDSKGYVYALDSLKSRIYVFNKKREIVLEFGKRGEKKGEFDFPVSLAVDRRGWIYIADRHKNKILIFNQKGSFKEEFSQMGWKEGKLNYPSYIFIDSSQRIYVVDRDNDRVQVFKR